MFFDGGLGRSELRAGSCSTTRAVGPDRADVAVLAARQAGGEGQRSGRIGWLRRDDS